MRKLIALAIFALLILLTSSVFAADRIMLMSSYVADEMFQAPGWSIPIIKVGKDVHAHFIIYQEGKAFDGLLNYTLTRNGNVVRKESFQLNFDPINPYLPEANGIQYIIPFGEIGYPAMKVGKYKIIIVIKKNDLLMLKASHKFVVQDGN